MGRIRACGVDDLAVGEIMRVDAGDEAIALYRLADGFFATTDTCTHAVASLSDGYLEDDTIECPLHMGRFCVRTGRPKGLPASAPLPTYRVEIADADVFITLETADDD